LDTMGMSPQKLENWLRLNTFQTAANNCINIKTNTPISAIVPMHTFGQPCRIDEIVESAKKHNIPFIEDSAESLGSFYKNKHTGTFGLAGILSFNGNKTITTGGGGMIITDSAEFAHKAKHLTTTAKVPHKWEYVHDRIAYNYRLTNISAAIGVIQMEMLEIILKNKRVPAQLYRDYFKNTDIQFIIESQFAKSNYWLNAILLKDSSERDDFLEYTNSKNVMTRPIWRLLSKLDMYKDCETDDLAISCWLEDRVVNIPSGYRG